MTPPPEDQRLSQVSAGTIDDLDARILADLAAFYDAADPVSAGLTERLKFGITLDALHAEVAELQRHAVLSGVRSDDTAEVQTVTFTSANLTVMVTITPSSADRARIDGWATPGAGLLVGLRTEAGTLETVADEDGRFSFADAPRGLAQFVIRAAGSAAGSQPVVVTPGMQI
jgi:hypothetical protein